MKRERFSEQLSIEFGKHREDEIIVLVSRGAIAGHLLYPFDQVCVRRKPKGLVLDFGLPTPLRFLIRLAG